MEKVVVLYNPNAKKGKISKSIPHIQRRLLTKYDECECVASKSGKDLEDLAYRHSMTSDCLVVVGGDGSVHNVINGIKRSAAKSIRLGILPMGTVNDVCKTLHIPKKLDKAIDVILRGCTLDYDIISDEQQYIVYTLSGGMFVRSSFETNKKLKKVFGKLAYFLHGAGELFRLKTYPMTFIADGEKYSGRYILALILNTYSTAGFYINGKSSVSDGKMEIVLIERKRSYLVALFTMVRLFLFGIGSLKKCKNVKIVSCEKCSIENHSQQPFTMDGERCDFLKKTIYIDSPVTVYHGIGI